MAYRKKEYDATSDPLEDGTEFFGPLFETEEAAEETIDRPSYTGPKGVSYRVQEVGDDHLTFAGRDWEPLGKKVLESGPWTIRQVAADIKLSYKGEEIARYGGALRKSTERGPADASDRSFIERWVMANEDWLAEHLG